jgi:hypothetical protein
MLLKSCYIGLLWPTMLMIKLIHPKPTALISGQYVQLQLLK